MKRVTRYQTSDGVLHIDERTAMRHADERFGTALIPLAREVVSLSHYVDAMNFIERNLPAFVELDKLKRDMIVDETETED